MPDTTDERTLVWCTGISGSQRTDYVNEAAEAIRAEGRSCLVLDIGELLEQLPDHLKVGASRTELLDGNEDVLRLHRSYALQNMLRMIEETSADVVLISTHACFLRNGRLMPGLDMHFIKEHFAGRISAFVTVVLDTPDVWRALAQRPEWAGRLRLAEVALWRDFEVALTRMLAEYEGAPFYLLARRDPAEGLARLTRRPPAPSAYLSYPITAILQSGSTELIDGARKLAARLRDEAGLVVFDPLSIEDLPQTKAGAPPDDGARRGRRGSLDQRRDGARGRALPREPHRGDGPAADRPGRHGGRLLPDRQGVARGVHGDVGTPATGASRSTSASSPARRST